MILDKTLDLSVRKATSYFAIFFGKNRTVDAFLLYVSSNSDLTVKFRTSSNILGNKHTREAGSLFLPCPFSISDSQSYRKAK